MLMRNSSLRGDAKKNRLRAQSGLRVVMLLQIGLLLLVLFLSGCSLGKLEEVNKVPELSPLQSPTERSEYQPVTMPMPTPRQRQRVANSLWRPGSRAFFEDLRAARIGDIVTVSINVQDSASVSNATSRSRDNTTSSGITDLAGLEDTVTDLLPGTPSLANLFGADGSGSHSGSGTIERNETIRMSVAAVITQELPNGNLVIYGRQELRVNNEVRELHVAGVIRPQDIDNSNAVAFERIAEARVAYGGRGQISDIQQPRWGAQVADILLPF